ncbi:MAG: DUF3168 domain-containing protein [Nitratireductor sp.]
MFVARHFPSPCPPLSAQPRACFGPTARPSVAGMADADVITALAEILKANADVSVLAGSRIYGGELPEHETASMPRGAIVLQPSGGASMTAGSDSQHDTQRIDLFAYGATPFEAERLRRVARRVLTPVRRVVSANCLVHWIEVAGGFASGRDARTQWPIAFQSFQIFFALQEV